MKSTELRLGNYLGCSAGIGYDYCVVTKISHDKIETVAGNNHVFGVQYEVDNAIPLTEEWLLKFGARVWGHESSRMASIEITEHMSFEINLVNGDFHIVYDDLVVEGDHACIAVNIKSIHKMQNLYFALTGKELTIK